MTANKNENEMKIEELKEKKKKIKKKSRAIQGALSTLYLLTMSEPGFVMSFGQNH